MRAGLALSVGLYFSVPCFPQQNASVSGTVVDQTRAVISNASITVEGALQHQVRSDSLGKFDFPELEPGPYKIVVESPGFRRYEAHLTLRVGEEKRLGDIMLKISPPPPCVGPGSPLIGQQSLTSLDGAALSGVVLVDGHKKKGVALKLYSPGGDRPQAKTRTDSSGAFIFRGLEPGLYDVAIEPDALEPFRARSLRVEHGVEVHLTFAWDRTFICL